jgi:hypothetical protein
MSFKLKSVHLEFSLHELLGSALLADITTPFVLNGPPYPQSGQFSFDERAAASAGLRQLESQMPLGGNG